MIEKHSWNEKQIGRHLTQFMVKMPKKDDEKYKRPFFSECSVLGSKFLDRNFWIEKFLDGNFSENSHLRVLFWSGVLICGSSWCDESGRRICFRPFGRVFRFIGFLKPSTGSVLGSDEPGFGHDLTTLGSTGDDRDGPTGILHRWKSVINSSRPLKVFYKF